MPSRAIQVQSLPRSHRLNDLLRATTVSAITWCGGTGQTRAGHVLTQAAPGANQLNTLDRSGEPGTRTRSAAGQHWHLLHRLTPRVAGRYCCALPEDLQGLHFSRVAASTCMSALDVPRRNAALQCWASSHGANQALFHLPPWDSPSPWGWLPVRGLQLHGTCLDGEVSAKFCPIPAACQQPGPKPFHAQADLNAYLLWWWKYSFWGEGAQFVPPLAISEFPTLLEEIECLMEVEVISFALSWRRHWTCLSICTFSPIQESTTASFGSWILCKSSGQTSTTPLPWLQEAAKAWGSWGKKVPHYRYFLTQKETRLKKRYGQHLLLANAGCAAPGIMGNDKKISLWFSLLHPASIHIEVQTTFCPDKPSRALGGEDRSDPSCSLFHRSHFSTLLEGLFILTVQNLGNEAGVGFFHSHSSGLLHRVQTLQAAGFYQS